MAPWIKKYSLNDQEVAQILEDFLEGKGTKWAWDNFTLGMSLENKNLEEIRMRCASLSQEFPSASPNEYCNEQGRKVIRDYAKQLRGVT